MCVARPLNRDRLRPGHVSPEQRRTRAAAAVALHPAVLGDREAVEVFGEVLHHVVALRLAVHDDVDADLLLQVDNALDLGLQIIVVLRLGDLTLGEGRALLANIAGLRKRADGRRRQKRQVERFVLRRQALLVRATVEVGIGEFGGASTHCAVTHARGRVSVVESSGCRIQLRLNGRLAVGQPFRERRDLLHFLVGEREPRLETRSQRGLVFDIVRGVEEARRA